MPVVFSVFFEEMEKAIKFKEHIIGLGYEKVVYFDNTNEAEIENLSKLYYHHVSVQKRMSLSIEWLNIETLKMYDIAKEFGGEYEAINFGELEDEEENIDAEIIE
jgi:hypothetical protein